MLIQRSKRLTCLLMSGTSNNNIFNNISKLKKNSYYKKTKRNYKIFLELGLTSEYVMDVEWDKCALQELDITATDLSTECLIDLLTRIPALKFLSAGQINGFNDSVLKAWSESGKTAQSLIALDLDSSDNVTDEGLHKFLHRHGPQLNALLLSGMPHITDQLWMSVLPILTNIK